MMKSVVFSAALLLSAQLSHATEGAHGDHEGTVEGVHATAEIHAMDEETINLTHDPIPEIGWPAMTMDLTILEDAEIGDVAPGDRVMIMLKQGPDGIYGIQSVMPAAQ